MDDYKVMAASFIGVGHNIFTYSQPFLSFVISVMTIIYLGKKIKSYNANKMDKDV